MKAFAIISDHQVLVDFDRNMSEAAEACAQRITFLRKQAEDEEKKLQKETDRLWTELERHLERVGMFPAGYSKKKHGLRVYRKAGTLCMYDKHEQHKCGPECIDVKILGAEDIPPDVARALIDALEGKKT